VKISDGTQDIYSIIKRHTGDNASDTKKFKTSEVAQMLIDAGKDLRISADERVAMLSALTTFGGSSLHPDLFENPKLDKAMLSKAVMAGIDTPAKFNRLTPQERGTFLYDGCMIGGGENVGMQKRLIETDLNNFYEVDFNEASDKMAALVDANLAKFKSEHGDINEDDTQVKVTALEHKNASGATEVYGYQVEISAPTIDGRGACYSTDILSSDGSLLKPVDNHFEPYSPA
jgi:hypothetical protein